MICSDSIIKDHFGLLIFFFARCIQGLLLDDEAWPWKNRTVETHMKLERKSTLWIQIDRVFLQKKKRKTSQQPHFESDLSHYFVKQHGRYNVRHWHNQSCDSTNDFLYIIKQMLWFLPSCMADFVPCDRLLQKVTGHRSLFYQYREYPKH